MTFLQRNLNIIKFEVLHTTDCLLLCLVEGSFHELTGLLYTDKLVTYTAQKMKFSIKDFFSKCDQIRRKLGIWSQLLKKSLTENFIFCAVMDHILSPLPFLIYMIDCMAFHNSVVHYFIDNANLSLELKNLPCSIYHTQWTENNT